MLLHVALGIFGGTPQLQLEGFRDLRKNGDLVHTVFQLGQGHTFRTGHGVALGVGQGGGELRYVTAAVGAEVEVPAGIAVRIPFIDIDVVVGMDLRLAVEGQIRQVGIHHKGQRLSVPFAGNRFRQEPAVGRDAIIVFTKLRVGVDLLAVLLQELGYGQTFGPADLHRCHRPIAVFVHIADGGDHHEMRAGDQPHIVGVQIAVVHVPALFRVVQLDQSQISLLGFAGTALDVIVVENLVTLRIFHEDSQHQAKFLGNIAVHGDLIHTVFQRFQRHILGAGQIISLRTLSGQANQGKLVAAQTEVEHPVFRGIGIPHIGTNEVLRGDLRCAVESLLGQFHHDGQGQDSSVLQHAGNSHILIPAVIRNPNAVIIFDMLCFIGKGLFGQLRQLGHGHPLIALDLHGYLSPLLAVPDHRIEDHAAFVAGKGFPMSVFIHVIPGDPAAVVLQFPEDQVSAVGPFQIAAVILQLILGPGLIASGIDRGHHAIDAFQERVLRDGRGVASKGHGPQIVAAGKCHVSDAGDGARDNNCLCVAQIFKRSVADGRNTVGDDHLGNRIREFSPGRAFHIHEIEYLTGTGDGQNTIINTPFCIHAAEIAALDCHRNGFTLIVQDIETDGISYTGLQFHSLVTIGCLCPILVAHIDLYIVCVSHYDISAVGLGCKLEMVVISVVGVQRNLLANGQFRYRLNGHGTGHGNVTQSGGDGGLSDALRNQVHPDTVLHILNIQTDDTLVRHGPLHRPANGEGRIQNGEQAVPIAFGQEDLRLGQPQSLAFHHGTDADPAFQFLVDRQPQLIAAGFQIVRQVGVIDARASAVLGITVGVYILQFVIHVILGQHQHIGAGGLHGNAVVDLGTAAGGNLDVHQLTHVQFGNIGDTDMEDRLLTVGGGDGHRCGTDGLVLQIDAVAIHIVRGHHIGVAGDYGQVLIRGKSGIDLGIQLLAVAHIAGDIFPPQFDIFNGLAAVDADASVVDPLVHVDEADDVFLACRQNSCLAHITTGPVNSHILSQFLAVLQDIQDHHAPIAAFNGKNIGAGGLGDKAEGFGAAHGVQPDSKRTLFNGLRFADRDGAACADAAGGGGNGGGTRAHSPDIAVLVDGSHGLVLHGPGDLGGVGGGGIDIGLQVGSASQIGFDGAPVQLHQIHLGLGIQVEFLPICLGITEVVVPNGDLVGHTLFQPEQPATDHLVLIVAGIVLLLHLSAVGVHNRRTPGIAGGGQTVQGGLGGGE